MQLCFFLFSFFPRPPFYGSAMLKTDFFHWKIWLNVGANCFSHVSELCKAMEKNEGHRLKSCLGSKKAGGHYVGDISMN